ncbi:hypothetical protein GCM10008090_34940 [Arenicella chitinivorans]|uniref:DUF3592 domain-containing protein n=1 Tax=Arenicella chitinivorans TaxID=1329800 RepID=A0A918VTT0_9GAMM|nr:hypothetical protein [Arenicella chitinivorans]GHA22120.1 hypothetical protein GCM10008090_34940 [Arenicella chitinivorans]
MKIKYSLPTKVLFSISLGFFLVAVSILFLPTIKANVIETKSAYFGGNGYSGIPRKGARSTNGSALSFSTYEFKLDKDNYEGWGLAEKYDGSTVEIRYLPINPAITFSSSMPYLFFSIFFMFLAIGARSVVIWATKILNRSAS